jgi:hypothetical protein
MDNYQYYQSNGTLATKLDRSTWNPKNHKNGLGLEKDSSEGSPPKHYSHMQFVLPRIANPTIV